MKNNELTVQIADLEVTAFMQGGFFDFENLSKNLHEHQYSEIHFVAQGEFTMVVDKTPYTLRSGDILVVPSKIFHYITDSTDDIRHCAFQVSLPVKGLKRFSFDRHILSAMMEEIVLVENGKSPFALSMYIALLCSHIIEKPKMQMKDIQDRKYLIHEFFSLNYDDDITLEDLAKRLNLSLKQTQREVLRHTGNNFRAELSRVRIEAAKQLMLTEDISLQECAKRVGYKSYSGFWKAYKHE